jgi:hypothetical protein
MIEPMTSRTQQTSSRRWVLPFLAALVAVLATLLSSATASAATNGTAETRVGASSVVVEVPVGPPEHISAGQRLGEQLAGPEIVVATGVAANAVRAAAPSTFTRAEALSGRASQRTVNEIAESMRANGWQGAPIDVVELQGQRIVVDGHHRLAAARRAGIDVQYQVVDPSSVIGPGRYTSIDDILQSTYSVGRDRLR